MRRKKKQSRTTAHIVGGIIAFLMISSVFGVIFFGFSTGNEKMVYNGYTFINLQQSYKVEIGGRMLEFIHFPEQLESISLDQNMIDRLRTSHQIDFTSDYSSEAAQEIAIAEFFIKEEYLKDKKYIRAGATSENQYNSTIITCGDATDTVPVIEWRLWNETGFHAEGDCIVAMAERSSDIIVLSERLVYSILGVMD